MKTLLILPILLWCTTAMGAELLVQAVDSPFKTGGKKGDVIVVRPDGWVWGKEECLPRYIIVKLPDLKEADAKKYEEQLTEEKVVEGVTTSELIRLRKYTVGAPQVDSVKFTAKSDLTVATKEVEAYVKDSIAVKDLATEKVAISAEIIK